MLVAFRALLEERRKVRAAVGAFTCYDVTTALGVIRAAEQRAEPVILLVSEASVRSSESRLLIPALCAVAERANVAACVQADHVRDEDLIKAALASGVGAVLADGSQRPWDANTALARRAVELAPANVGVEAELGHIEGSEDIAAAAAAGAFTDPAEAAAFVRATGVDCLAVSIGNVHGAYASEPNLDWKRLEQIRDEVGDVPLSLHGASGLPPSDIRRAISLGVCKVNVNTELRRRYFDLLTTRLPELADGLRLIDLQAALVSAVAEASGALLELFSPQAEHAADES